MADSVQTLEEVQVEQFIPNQPRVQPPTIPRVKLTPKLDSNIETKKVINDLRSGIPSVIVDYIGDSLIINPHTLTEEEAEIVIRQVIDVISRIQDVEKEEIK